MEEAQKLEIGQRIKELRERSPYAQQRVADELGIKLRAYQKLEAVGTERFERCEEIAKIHAEWTARDPEWSHASAEWIWDGKSRVSSSQSPLDALSKKQGEASLTEVVAAVETLRVELASAKVELLAEIAKVQAAQEAPPSKKSKTGQR